MEYIRKIQDRLHLGRCQGLADIGLRDEEKLGGVLALLKSLELVCGVYGLLECRNGRGFRKRLLCGSPCPFLACPALGVQIVDMDSHQILLPVIVQVQEPVLLPIFQGAEHILLRVIELVSNAGYAYGLAGVRHAQQVQVHLDLCIICILHIFVNEQIGYNRDVHGTVLVDCQRGHHIHFLPEICGLRILQ